ncbi:MAG: site-2 protease family protein [Halorientalis sp.]
MGSTLTWVLVGIVLYTGVAMALRAWGRLPDAVRVQGPITTIHTKRGRAFLDWLAAPRRFWRAWGNFGVGIALVVMVGSFLMVLFAGLRSVQQPEATAVQNPQNVLVIPGVNEFLPLAAAPEIVFGLLVGLVVHEGGHGLLCRVEDIDIDSMGLALFTLVPVGAFVEPDEDSRERASRGSQTRMFAAGVTNNFAITIVAFALLFGPIIGSIAVVDGVPVGDVAPGSAAAAAGIERGAVITAVAGRPVANASELDAVLRENGDRTVTVRRKEGPPVTVNRTLMLTRAVPGVLDGRAPGEGVNLTGPTPPRIIAVNGTPVFTEQDFAAAVANRTVVRLTTTAGNATIPVGAYVSRLVDGGPLASAPGAAEPPLVVTRVGEYRVTDTASLASALSHYDPGETVSVETYRLADGRERATYNVTLGTGPTDGDAYLGVYLQRGTSGLTVADFGIDPYPARQFLVLLGGGDGLGGSGLDSLTRQVFAVLLLPFVSVLDPNFAYNFAGFVPAVADFYVVTGPLAALGGWVFLLANLTFWTAWINLQLGLFNCIPAFPLDGGHLLRTSTEAIVARLPVEAGRRLTTAVTVSISLVMLAGLFLMVFGPGLLAG